MSDHKQFWSELGERVCAPLYFSLCHWIREQVQKRHIKKILFLARDGLILKETWERFFDEEGEAEPVYLWASRRCLRVARMEQLGDAEKALILSRKGLSPSQCLHQLGLDLPGPRPELDWNRPMQSEKDRTAFLAYLDSISESILEQARKERECLLAYLDSLGLITEEEEPVALVDLGWQGNLQAALQELLQMAGSRVQLHGFYMGTITPVGVKDPVFSNGLFFTHSIPESPCRTIRHCQLLVETLFAAPHPSVKRIRREGNSFRPEFVPLDEHEEIQPFLVDMQQAALTTIENNQESWERDPEKPRKEGLQQLSRLLRDPTETEAGILGDVKHFGGFGQALELQPLACPSGPPMSLWKLRNQYRQAYWRKGFLKRLKPWQRLALAPLIIGMAPDRS